MLRIHYGLVVLTVLALSATSQAAVVGRWDFEDYAGFSPGDKIPSDGLIMDTSGNGRYLRNAGQTSLITAPAGFGGTAAFFGGAGGVGFGYAEFAPGFDAFSNSALTASSIDIVLGAGTDNFTIQAIVQLPHNADGIGPPNAEGGILGKGSFVADSDVDGWGLTSIANGGSHINSLEGFMGDSGAAGLSRVAKPLAMDLDFAWQHVALTRNRQTDEAFLYVNYQLVASVVNNTTTGDFGNTVGNFVIGSNAELTKFFRGGISFVQLDDTVLQPFEFEGASAVDPDIDSSGFVDGNDFLIWQRGFGLTGQVDKSNGDAFQDGTIDGVDLDVIMNSYGQPFPLLAGTTNVPEPTSLAIALLASAGLAMGTRSRSLFCR